MRYGRRRKKGIQDSGGEEEEEKRKIDKLEEISNQSLNDPRGKRNQPTNS